MSYTLTEALILIEQDARKTLELVECVRAKGGEMGADEKMGAIAELVGHLEGQAHMNNQKLLPALEFAHAWLRTSAYHVNRFLASLPLSR